MLPRAAVSFTSPTVDVDDRIRECPRRFLRKVVADAAVQQAVRVFAGDPFRVRPRIRVWRAIGVPFERDRGHRDHRTHRKAPFQIVVLWFAFGDAKPPTIVVDHEADVIGVVECLRGSRERLIVFAVALSRCPERGSLRFDPRVQSVYTIAVGIEAIVLTVMLQLLFRKRHWPYGAHLVFAIHFVAFISLNRFATVVAIRLTLALA